MRENAGTIQRLCGVLHAAVIRSAGRPPTSPGGAEEEGTERTADPEWARLRDGLLEVLRPHAKAYEAVTEWLKKQEEEAKKAA